MSSQMWRWLLAVVVGAHGIGHVLFLVSLAGWADWGGPTRSWLLTDLIGDTATRIAGSLLWLAVTAGFVAVAVGILGQQAWWRGLALGSAAASILALILYWTSPLPSTVLSALGFDVVIVVALLFLRWPPASLLGA